MVLLVTDVFVLLTQVLLWVVVGLFTWYVLLRALPKAFLGGLVIALLLGVSALTFYLATDCDSVQPVRVDSDFLFDRLVRTSERRHF
jgi:hypothetical protein